MQREELRLFGGRFRGLATFLGQLRDQLGDGVAIETIVNIGTFLATVSNRFFLDKSDLSHTLTLLQLVGQFLAVEGGYGQPAATKRRIMLAGDILLTAATLTPSDVDDRVAEAVRAFLANEQFAQIVAQIVAERFAGLPDGVLPMYGAQPIELMGECLQATERVAFDGELLRRFLPLLWELLGELFGLMHVAGAEGRGQMAEGSDKGLGPEDSDSEDSSLEPRASSLAGAEGSGQRAEGSDAGRGPDYCDGEDSSLKPQASSLADEDEQEEEQT